MRAFTSLWMIRMLTYELDELFRNSERDARKYKAPRWSLRQFTAVAFLDDLAARGFECRDTRRPS